MVAGSACGNHVGVNLDRLGGLFPSGRVILLAPLRHSLTRFNRGGMRPSRDCRGGYKRCISTCMRTVGRTNGL